MKRVLSVLGGLIVAGVSSNATTSFSLTGAVELISPPVSIDAASIDPASIDEALLQSDAVLFSLIFSESGPEILGSAPTFYDTPNAYTPDTYTSDPSDSALADGIEFVTYFLHCGR